MAKILCVEDGNDTLLVLESTLKGHELHFAKSVKVAVEMLQINQFDLVLLDVELPDGTGLELLADAASRIESTPVIFLTSKSDFPTRVSAFSLGADDYIQKPFDPRDLKIRAEAKIRKALKMKAEQDLIKVGPVVCNVSEQRIYRSGEENSNAIELTALEFKIFVLLARTPNKVFSRSEILERVWGSNHSITERAVDVHVSNLRKKLNQLKVDVEGVVGTGYRIKVAA